MAVLRQHVLWLTVPVAAAVGLFALVQTSAVNHGRGDLRITVIDVGQGDSICVQTPSGHVLLIDGGGVSDTAVGAPDDPGERDVIPFLRHAGINAIDIVILTHPHGDHVGGLTAVLRRFRVGCVLDGTTMSFPTPAYRAFLSQIVKSRIEYRHARRGMRLDFGDGVSGVVLNPPGSRMVYGTTPDDTTMNNYSVVLRLSYKGTVCLLDGDAEKEAEDNVLAAYPASYLRCTFLKAGHHGSRNASSDEWLWALDPQVAAVSCGFHNRFGHPHTETLQRMAAHRIPLYRTDLDGAITFETDGNRWSAFSVRRPRALTGSASALRPV